MTTCRRLLSGFIRLSLCLALAFAAGIGQGAVSSPAAAQSADVRVYVYYGTGSGVVKRGTPITISATPFPGYEHVSWNVYGGVAANPASATTTVTVNPTSSFVFAVPVRRLIPSANPAFPLTVFSGTGSGAYAAGTKVAISAEPVRGNYSFSSWYDPAKAVADPTSPSTTFTMPANRAYVFPMYRLTPASTDTVTVTVAGGTGGGRLKPGSTGTLTAIVPANMVFDRWTSNVPVTITNTAAATTTYIVPATAVTISAAFKAAPAAPTFDVTVTGGTINNGPGTGKFKEGDRLTIKANAAAAGKVFDVWTGMVATLADATKDTTILTVGKTAVVVAATYKDAPVAPVRVTVVGGVVVTPSSTGTYTPGAQVSIRANAAPAGREFDRWTATTGTFVSATASTTDFTVPATAATVTATYKVATPTGTAVTLSSHKNGDTVDVRGETVVGVIRAVTSADTLEATISTNGRKTLLDFDKTTGDFALRLFEGESTVGQAVSLTFVRKDKVGTTETSVYNLTGAARPASLQMVAGRLSFGATPALLNQMKTMTFNAWVEQQLNPNTISDAALVALNPDAILRTTVSEPYQLREEIPMWQMAYAAYSQRQLREVMTTFWNNHFWSTHTEVTDTDMADIDEIRGFRANAFGRFRDLLEVSAKSPQMMVFLDNIFSNANGFNQNYARELFELHTVGVNGGYTVADVNGAARAFSGWGIRKTSADGVKPVTYVFEFNKDRHIVKEAREIAYLGLSFPVKTAAATDITEGEQILDRLAMHPKTQEFVCGKLVELLVSDARPPAFIQKCTTAWQSSGGLMSTILRAILLDPLYLTSVSYERTKAKTPFESMTAFLRNFGVYPVAGKERDFYNTLRRTVEDSGMDMVHFTVPTGFKEVGSAWTNTASFITKYRGLTDQARSSNQTGTGGRGTVNYTNLVKAARMTTPEAAAAYLLALTAADRYRKDEYDLAVNAIKGT
ncbi:MAG: DUF1800 family protein, partial [Hyphomicrobiaceae bacterium]|nr:DUF1800 family protein [Hyphomicrobiaceae bacterium]